MQECPLYTEPELYDLLFPSAADSESILDPARRERIVVSERFYVEEAAKGGPVLELACGTGRLTIPIAQKGVEIVGADVAQSMLEAARAKAKRLGVPATFVAADMRSSPKKYFRRSRHRASVDVRYGEYSRIPFVATSPRQVYLCSVAAALSS